TYVINVASNQIFDIDGMKHAVPAGAIGSFAVSVGQSIVVNATNDETTDTDGKASLREALALANKVAVSLDTITFDSTVFATPQTIISVNGEYAINGAVTIMAPAAANVTLDAKAASRVINTSGAPAGSAITLSSLTVTNGKRAGATLRTDNGGGILIGDE